ncbi:DMT family transporter [Amycolatopsis rhizosphaerae]|uniref:DMT family transporter n=1 Tax=Amycolatopsis rhizosphaerae TaxID=2053003 RepID=A0A558DJS4_9PSEU|nr:DMT family transporter [Amycolatopsis rhizosphaerae]TVT61272.1 DMT family transporter [Amycolatopsis rhizosphaerae]
MNTAAAQRRTEVKALLAATVTVVLWSSAFVVIRDAGSYLSPGVLALGRLVTGALALGGVLLVRREGFPPRAAWPGIVTSGILWFGVYMVALNAGEQRIDAGTASLVINVGPILMAVLGGWLLGEGFPPQLIAGIPLAFAGAVLVGFASSGGGEASVTGVLLCLLAAVGSAAGVIAQKPALRHASALQVTAFGSAIGAVACLPFAGNVVGEISSAPPRAIGAILYLGLFPTALAFSTWAYALSRTTAGRMGATTYLVPVVVILLSWVAVGEIPAPLSFAGGAMCLAGVAVARRKPKSDKQKGDARDR